MKIFLLPSARHLAARLPMQASACEFGAFSDGEIRVRVNESVEDHAVWVIAGTQPPAENILHLLFFLDALQRHGVKLHLSFTYFAYARQDRVTAPGESLSAKVIGDSVARFPINRMLTIHMLDITEFLCEILRQENEELHFS